MIYHYKSVIIIGLALIGLYFHVEYSGWVLFFGLCGWANEND